MFGHHQSREEVERDLLAGGTPDHMELLLASPSPAADGVIEWHLSVGLHTPDGGAMWQQHLPEHIRLVPGQVVPVLYDPIHVEQKIMVDPRQEGLLEPEVMAIRAHAPTGGPRWIVPHQCPNCGAIVDQTIQGNAEHPACTFCHEPLPVEAGAQA